ncbi:MAG: methionyl-tRNA formyltransferase [Candidatus Marinimicrobia bacterium]|nr:methionyl-tRNA formyltransferase [Candidatus Neomarinimicrobiota bacterium]
MRIVFMGNPEFAVPSLQRIVNSKHELITVVTNPDRPVGRGRRLQPSAVAQAAADLGLSLIQPETLHDSKFHSRLNKLQPDLFVVVAFRILPRAILSIPVCGSINLHASLLPRYRGAAPIQWALINGDSETGLTTFLIKPKVDTGDMLDQISVVIKPDDDFGSLSERMQLIGADLLIRTIDKVSTEAIKPSLQDKTQVTSAPKITMDICRIDWSKSAVDILNLIRGLSPAPGAHTRWRNKRLKIFAGRVIEDDSDIAQPGTIVALKANEIQVRTGLGILAIEECQLEGKRRLVVDEFLRGIKIQISEVLGE